ncbi:TetR/AcrR family transcriptional regulator [Mesorhizobium sp. B1-1-8]|uniref:TetR/AcrR family transcriptional regulator n=1 Tax=Mesorhizobium sp. B1-1-8 TaxID=2589976 RepID=UPI001126A90F|nr:TetR/AcrR family transcriptional regulator [Mesorhizobium sp. B1-1-8]UCI06915.1 TetR/AcrR family transcriptional regulator [Mesorhizobium sp. B1-1-8]
MHKPRKEMIAETRAKLIAAARHAFGTIGYADASMDDFTASAGLTRGALYHHFGDKKGLLQAVIAEIDGEMAARVNEVASRAPTRWQHFVDECTTYIEMALEPEIQRIMFRDGPAVLGDPAQWANANACVASMTEHLTALQQEGVVVPDLDPETAARLINGASSQASQRIANSKDPEATSKKAIAAFKQLLEGLLKKPKQTTG